MNTISVYGLEERLMNTDEARFEWLLQEYDKHGFLTVHKTSPGECHEPDTCNFFTISSQHVYGQDFRDAIDLAMAKKAVVG
jgi:predicted metal-binding protein